MISRTMVAATAAVFTLAVALAVAACGGDSSPRLPLGLPTEIPAAEGALGALSYAVPCYVAQGGASIVAASGCTVSVQSGGTMSFSGGALTVSSGSVSLGGGKILGHTIYGTATPATVVTGTALAPGAFVQPVTIATAGTVPLTIPSAGVRVCIHNTGSQAVTIADTGNQVLAGNFALGQYDVLCGFSDGTRFIETSRSNN